MLKLLSEYASEFAGGAPYPIVGKEQTVNMAKSLMEHSANMERSLHLNPTYEAMDRMNALAETTRTYVPAPTFK